MSRSKPLNDLILAELRLALSIAEGPSLKVSGQKLVGCGAIPFRRLRDFGLLVRKGATSSIACPECDNGHHVPVSFDHQRQEATGFCGEAGRFTVEPALLDVYEFDLNSLLNWIARALRIPPKQSPIPWIEGHLWELGEAKIEGQMVRVFFVRGVDAAQTLERVEQRLSRLANKSKTGAVLTASPAFRVPHRLWSAFSILDIWEVIDGASKAISIDRLRLLQLVEPEATVDRYRSGSAGRPTAKDLILEELGNRIESGLASLDRQEEAAVLKAWVADRHPDARQPTIKTVLNNIAEPHRAYRTSRIPRPK